MTIQFIVYAIIVLCNDKVEMHFNCPFRTSPESPDDRGFFLFSKTVELYSNQKNIIRLEFYVL